ncbi:MAG: hypothetical protein RLZZ496_1559 [Pseudomonadota bacterium]
MIRPAFSKFTALVTLLAAFASPAVVFAQQSGTPQGGAQQGGASQRIVPVLLGTAKREAVPVQFETIGTVQPVASVILRPRVEGQILEISFADGALVKAGDVLVRLDSRGIDAQVRQAEATVQRTTAQLEQAQRDVSRNEALAANEFASKVNLENAKTQVAAFNAQLASDRAALDNLRVTQSYYTIAAPISGRAGVAGLKPGNIAKTGDGSVPFTVINQISPIYVAFSTPQRFLPDLKSALGNVGSSVEATIQGVGEKVKGKIAVIDNAVDTTSGTVMVRAIFDNEKEALWPGALCNVRVTLKVIDNAVTVPREAVQTGPRGTYVYIVDKDVAKLKPVKTGRTVNNRTEITEGLSGDEQVVTDGQIQLTDGVKIEPKGSSTGAP